MSDIVERAIALEKQAREFTDKAGDASQALIVLANHGELALSLLPALCAEILSLRTALSTAREEGRREGLEEAANAVDNIPCIGPGYVHYDYMAATIRALKDKTP